LPTVGNAGDWTLTYLASPESPRAAADEAPENRRLTNSEVLEMQKTSRPRIQKDEPEYTRIWPAG
jgi:hypothetical protein